MIRGAIEVAKTDLVEGWLFCTAAPLRGQVVLAFVDARCVGAGKIDVFRHDLKKAGLGDGYSGFSIPITLSEPEEMKAVTVRLECSDLALLQKDAVVRHESMVLRQKRRHATGECHDGTILTFGTGGASAAIKER